MNMMKKGFILCLVCALAMIGVSHASEGTDFINELLEDDNSNGVAMGETIILGNALEFSIPSDWERSFDYEQEENVGFLFKGIDEEGRNVYFIGINDVNKLLGAELSSYDEMKAKLVEAKTAHVVSHYNGIDVFFAGEDLMMGMCLTQQNEFIAFGFGSDTNKMSEIRQSAKLKNDMSAILNSVRPIRVNALQTFDIQAWEESRVGTEQSNGQAAGTESVKKDVQDAFFEGVVSGNGINPDSHLIYQDKKLVVSIPDDWTEIESEGDIGCTFTGADETGNHATVQIDTIQGGELTIDDLEAEANKQIASCTITTSNTKIFTALTESSLVTTWLDENGIVYRLFAYLDSEDGMRSEKLIADLHQVMCRIRPVYDGELEQNEAMFIMAEANLSDEEPVVFQSKELERMVRSAMGISDDRPIYPSELAAIRNMSIRAGILLFSREIQQPQSYKQQEIIHLEDMKLFPNLLYLNITGMQCAGYEALSGLSQMRHLLLIRTGVHDCGFLVGMHLNELNLAGNNISDFSGIADVKELKELVISYTGVNSLNFVQQLDLTMLVAAETPIYDLETISGMKGLTKLYIQGTEVRSLEPLRNLMELEELNIRDLKGEVSLEPLYGHGKLKRIFNLGTKLNAEDVEEMRAILFDNNGLPSVTERQIDSTSAPSSKPSPVPENPVVPEFPASEESNDISRCREVLMSFISQWSRNSLEDMLEYCSLDWRKENENPKTALFLLMANRTPMSYALYDMQINGDTVTADLIMLIDRNNGKDPQYYSFEIQMIREAEDWYIEPRSLRNYEAAGE